MNNIDMYNELIKVIEPSNIEVRREYEKTYIF